jgi:hypothetical protein
MFVFFSKSAWRLFTELGRIPCRWNDARAPGFAPRQFMMEYGMTTKPPPVPPANRSDKGPGSATEAPLSQGKAGSQTKDPDKIGQAGNSKVNTTNQGYQQDR